MTVEANTALVADFPKKGFVRKPQICSFLRVSETTLYRLYRDGDFPKPIRLTPRITVWCAEDIHLWRTRRTEEANA
jgi:prophage regulatory protein